jgi:hypothetical protein
MKPQEKINYDQILGIISQLPEMEMQRLFVALQAEIGFKKTSGNLQNLILQAPTWSDLDFKEYQSARELINKSRIA